MKFDKADLEARIAELGKASKSYHELLAMTAIGCVMHGILHGDPVYANRMLSTLQNSAGDKKNALRLNPLRQWFTSPISPYKASEREVVNPETGKAKIVTELVLDTDKAKALRAEYEAGKAKFLGKLKSKPWYEVMKEKEDWKGFDFDEQLLSLLNRARREAEKHNGSDKLNLGRMEAVAAAFYEANGASENVTLN